MDINELKKLLELVSEKKIGVDSAIEKLKQLPFEDIGFAKLDHHRTIRNGYPEVIYCEGKTYIQVLEIIKRIFKNGNNILGTRANADLYNYLKKEINELVYYEEARILYLKVKDIPIQKKVIGVISAGTSDMPVAEEAAITAEILGNKVERFYDVGVAGIHRLFANMDKITKANVLVVIAGMEGALASVVGGMVDKPVIAVPTSVGYGANFNGLAPLLTMLNSCASGVSVVNIDNGFGAGYLASMINKL